MRIVDRVQLNLLTNPYAGTNRAIHESFERWIDHAKIACYSCGSTNIGGTIEPIGWLCESCIKRHQEGA